MEKEERKMIYKGQLILLLIALLVIAPVSAYLILSSTIATTVEEAISVSPTSVEVKLHPKESEDVTFTLTNVGSVEIEVDFAVTVTGPEPSGITVAPSSGVVNVPGDGTATQTITVTAGKSVKPGEYTVTISWNR